MFSKSSISKFSLIKPAILILTFLTLLSCQPQKQKTPEWSFTVSDRIQSGPIVDDNMIFFGSNDGNFYAIDAGNGKEIWRKKTDYKIRSQAVTTVSTVYFSSGNNLYALDKRTGYEVWSYSSEDSSGARVFDPWDYHSGSPIIYNKVIYVGFGNGKLMGFKLGSGKEVFKLTTTDSAAIRSTPVIHKDVVYFGDWAGKIYAANIKTGEPVWTHKTYEKQPYPTFGQVNTQLIIHDSLLIFGARNPELQALNILTGNKVWSHIEVEGGWVSGDPLVSGDTMYIGGSDNHKMIAFDIYSGKIQWTYEFLFNSFSQPLIEGNHIFFTTGDAYASFGTGAGNGYLYALNKTNGSLVNMAHFDGNIFTSPVIHDGKIIIAGDDHLIRTIDLRSFIETNAAFPANGKGPVDNLQATNDSLSTDIIVSFEMKFAAPMSIGVLDLNGQLINLLFEDEQQKGDYQLRWQGTNTDGEFVADGYYMIQARSGIIIKNQFIQFVNSTK